VVHAVVIAAAGRMEGRKDLRLREDFMPEAVVE
jgi:hypothetical protein